MHLQQIEQHIPAIFITFVVSVIVTVFALDIYGYINHSTVEDGQVIDQFTLLAVEPDHRAKMSMKDSGKRAECVDGYILMRAVKNQMATGLLVDSNNRGVKCSF